MPRYAGWLERILTECGHQVALARPKPCFSRLARHPALIKYLGYLDKYLLFPPRLRRLAKAYDLVHVADHSNSMYLRAVRGKPNVITCHDVLAIRAAKGEFPAVTTSWSGRLLQRWILSGLRAASHLVCVSNKTAGDLKALTGETGAQVRIVYHSLNWGFRPNGELTASLVSRLELRKGQPYLLHVGRNQWYKNRQGVIRIFARLTEKDGFSTVQLVMAGDRWTAGLRDLIREERLEDRVREAGSVTNEELRGLYGNAVALLFPSLEEGFGWPILEAQACGCPVIATGRPPMTEIAGGAAIFIDPADPPAAAAAIAEGLRRREQLRAAGFRNLQRFDEKAIAEQYCAFYLAILEEMRTTVR